MARHEKPFGGCQRNRRLNKEREAIPIRIVERLMYSNSLAKTVTGTILGTLGFYTSLPKEGPKVSCHYRLGNYHLGTLAYINQCLGK